MHEMLLRREARLAAQPSVMPRAERLLIQYIVWLRAGGFVGIHVGRAQSTRRDSS